MTEQELVEAIDDELDRCLDLLHDRLVRACLPEADEKELWQDILRDADDFRAKWVIKAKRIARSHHVH